MPIKRNGLGKGLDSLIPDKNVKPEAEAKVSAEKLKNKNPKDEQADQANIYDNPTGELLLNINEVEPNRSQPRKEFDEDTLLEGDMDCPNCGQKLEFEYNEEDCCCGENCNCDHE